LYLGELSLRRYSVLIHNLPPGSSVWAISNDIPLGWTMSDFLLADLFHAFSGEAHPARPTGKEKSAQARVKQVASKLLQQQQRLQADSTSTS